MISNHQISSGVKVLMETVSHTKAVSMGFFFNTGSAWEPLGNRGWSHLVEHMVFKGTNQKTQKEIALAIDRVGGDLNAYTDKEEISFYCTLPSDHWGLGLELLSDMLQDPIFPENELRKEKSVIYKEISAIKDDPEDWIFEEFIKKLWPSHPYGNSVAGNPRDLRTANHETLMNYFKQVISTSPLTIAIAGDFSRSEVLKTVEKLIVPRNRWLNDFATPQAGRQFSIHRKTRYQMDQILWGMAIPSNLNYQELLVLQLFSLSFGETMGSRLFQNVREKKGLCYSISSVLGDFRKVHSIFITASTSPRSTPKLISTVEKEWKNVLSQGLEKEEIIHGISSMRGSTLLQMENMEYRMNRLFQHDIRFGMIHDWENTDNLLKSISVEMVESVLEKTFRRGTLSFLLGSSSS
ncbi:MAG: hypothetical protein A2Z96_00455 [Spirochaetes bacterium GWB1_48_6]|nr:MAG: hypothetical protein A2Z96_00455 [Spirochaetes bacterium GWB1_48_6]